MQNLYHQDSTTLLFPASSEIYVPQILIIPANGIFSSHNLESTSVISPLRDISNSQTAHKQGSHLSRPKWTRVARTAPRVYEVLNVHAGEKRILHLAINHRGLQKKSKSVSQDDKENNQLLAATGLQPHQGP